MSLRRAEQTWNSLQSIIWHVSGRAATQVVGRHAQEERERERGRSEGDAGTLTTTVTGTAERRPGLQWQLKTDTPHANASRQEQKIQECQSLES